MSSLSNLVPIINSHLAELKKPGVISVRPGFLVKNNWPTKEPAIVVTISEDAGAVDVPASIDNVTVQLRKANAVEELRFQDPDQYKAIALQHVEFRGGAFPEVDPVADEEEAASYSEAEFADIDLLRGGPKKPHLDYTPADMPLTPITGKIPIVCHVSPDAGWPTLSNFLSGVKSKLTVGLYDFTSKHILDTVSGDLSGKGRLEIVLDNPAKNPTADQTDSETVSALEDILGANFQQAWALVRTNKAIERYIYPSAYHIKVAVRDGNSVWVSSGNWNNSNQPDMDPFGNPSTDDQHTARNSDRDWHVIIEDPHVAGQFEAYIRHDFEVASTEQEGERGLVEAVPIGDQFRSATAGTFEFQEPLRIEDEELTITPLLTPDAGSYRPAMLELIRSAQKTLYIQLQYIHPPKDGVDEEFKELLDAVIDKIKSGLDVKIICSQWQTTQGWLERLQDSGINLDNVKIQNGVHNKGFVVDGKKVALGSQNWSGDGVLRNRDASVIIESPSAAKYYEKIFLHDWNRIAQRNMNQ